MSSHFSLSITDGHCPADRNLSCDNVSHLGLVKTIPLFSARETWPKSPNFFRTRRARLGCKQCREWREDDQGRRRSHVCSPPSDRRRAPAHAARLRRRDNSRRTHKGWRCRTGDAEIKRIVLGDVLSSKCPKESSSQPVEHRQGAAIVSFGQEINPVLADIHLRVLRVLRFHFP